MLGCYIVHFLCFYSMKMGNYYYNNELMKITFANMWTNTCCSHPLCVPSELGVDSSLEGSKDVNNLTNAVKGAKVAAQRKLEHELGIPFEDAPIENFTYLTRIHYKSPSGDESSKWGTRN